MSIEKLLIIDFKSNNFDDMSKKQIEEMANEINEMDEPNAHYYDETLQQHEAFADCFTIARYLYEKGYRKQSENVIELPCKIGDEIWYIDKKHIVQKAEVTCIDIRSTSRHIIAARYVWEIEETIKLALMFERLNVDYWLTKEEAEEALAKMKGGE